MMPETNILVSAIMPTANRRHLVPLALHSFLAQDWPDKELIVIEDGDDCVADLFAAAPNLRYHHHRLHRRQSIGDKLNLACKLAQGDILVRFDDDDWSAPGRITDQVNRLGQFSVSGYNSMIFWDQATRQATQYKSSSPFYSLGSALCFTRAYWQAHPFANCSNGEDNIFIQPARNVRRIACVDAGDMMVARIHAANTVNRSSAKHWPKVPLASVPPQFFADLLTTNRELP